MSILDLVKHAVKTVIHSLTDQDRLSIVAFDSTARNSLFLTVMNEDGKARAIVALEALQPDASTNIWAGLEAGLDTLKTKRLDNEIYRRKFLLLLTDGQPVESPHDGEDGALKRYYNSYPEFKCQVNTFGFGYSLVSSLLLNIATVGGGTFSFIPDAKILGTNFVNAIANYATTLSINAKVHLFPVGHSTITGDVGGCIPFEKEKLGNGYTVKIGNLQYGQKRDLYIPMNISQDQQDYLAVILEFESSNDRIPNKVRYVGRDYAQTHDSLSAYARNYAVKEIFTIISDFSFGKNVKGQKDMKALSGQIELFDTDTENNEPRLRGLLCDIVGIGEKGGRIVKAVSTVERFNRWGQHYLRSICRAHQLQLRTNFMDPGLQIYGSDSFVKLEELGGKIFVSLPMKKRTEYTQTTTSTSTSSYQSNTSSYQPPPPDPIDNTTYYSGGGGGCFDESCFVAVLNGGKLVKTYLPNVKKNDMVSVDQNGELGFARVLCVIQVDLGHTEKLIEFPSTQLKLTQKHPIYFNNQWQLPVDIAKKDNTMAKYCDSTSNYVYNFILESSHILLINNMRCVTLGHGIKEAFHPFYGTNEVIKALKTSQTFEQGYIQVKGSIRNMNNSPKYEEITKLNQDQRIENWV